MTLRRFYVGGFVAVLATTVWLILSYKLPWPVVFIGVFYLPLIFDGGRADAIDQAHKELKPLLGKSERFDDLLVTLASQRLRGARAKMVRLKIDFPEERDRFERADKALIGYIESKKWWQFWKLVQ